jgi:hypothetical protein
MQQALADEWLLPLDGVRLLGPQRADAISPRHGGMTGAAGW